MSDIPPVCDYEGSDYQSRFWGGGQRSYEDQAERVALQAMMPAKGTTVIDIGAGFGRLANEFDGYKQVVLFDYSRSLLREAQAHLGNDRRFYFVAGNWYEMPFVTGLFQTLVQVRTIHHAAKVPALFSELSRISQSNATYVLEFANKQNLKAILRHAIGKQEWSPYDRDPIEFVELNFDFHPKYIIDELKKAGFHVKHRRAVSYFRLGFLKKHMPMSMLVGADKLLQPTGNFVQLAPSIFNLCQQTQVKENAKDGTFFACPACQEPLGAVENKQLNCGCGKSWRVENNLYDFKEPIE
jgi:ubiquinone/menaquinone biosynthesis C-methylase UbiE